MRIDSLTVSALVRCPPGPCRADRYSSASATPSGTGSRGLRIHTSCAVVSSPILDRASARWCLTVECDRPRWWAASFYDPATRTAATTPTSRSVARSAGRDGRRVMCSGAIRWRYPAGADEVARRGDGRAVVVIAVAGLGEIGEGPTRVGVVTRVHVDRQSEGGAAQGDVARQVGDRHRDAAAASPTGTSRTWRWSGS
jgi:hypothetical protein